MLAYNSVMWWVNFNSLILINKYNRIQVIDWNQSSLVHIGELKSSTATVLFEVHESIQAVYSAELEQKVYPSNAIPLKPD